MSLEESERWGQPTPSQMAALLPEERRPEGVMEVFLLGGMSPWESFFTVPDYGSPARGGPYSGQQWWTYQPRTGSEKLPGLTVPDWMAACGPASAKGLTIPWTKTRDGLAVNLGPFIYPLWDRPDLIARMRVWVMSHEIEPHETGIPYALTGRGLGNPKMAAPGAHVQRFYQDAFGAGAPVSYVVYPGTVSVTGNAGAASAVGLHRAAARPLPIQLGADARLVSRLPRGNVAGYRSELDALVRSLSERARSRLVGPTGAPLRSSGLEDFVSARDALERHATLSALLRPDLVTSAQITACVDSPLPSIPKGPVLDEPSTAIRLGAHLLRNSQVPARYVQVLEGGLYTDPAGQGYDSHAAHVKQQGTNLAHAMRALVDTINRPGEADPSKLDLDRHFVLLNTEFGRSPIPEFTIRNPDGGGTNHWPWGYVVVGFGGFVDESRAGLVGHIGEDGRAEAGFRPEELRAALLLAMGIWPFSPEAFNVGDIRTGQSELEAALFLRREFLGYAS